MQGRTLEVPQTWHVAGLALWEDTTDRRTTVHQDTPRGTLYPIDLSQQTPQDLAVAVFSTQAARALSGDSGSFLPRLRIAEREQGAGRQGGETSQSSRSADLPSSTHETPRHLSTSLFFAAAPVTPSPLTCEHVQCIQSSSIRLVAPNRSIAALHRE
jgi:hypothetical protein